MNGIFFFSIGGKAALVVNDGNLLRRVVLEGIGKITITVFSSTVVTGLETGYHYLSSTVFLFCKSIAVKEADQKGLEWEMSLSGSTYGKI